MEKSTRAYMAKPLSIIARPLDIIASVGLVTGAHHPTYCVNSRDES